MKSSYAFRRREERRKKGGKEGDRIGPGEEERRKSRFLKATMCRVLC